MATKIDIERPSSRTRLNMLGTGDSFLLDGELFMVRGPCTKMVVGVLKETGEVVVTRMSSGYPRKLEGDRIVEPVDIEIKVVRK